jgi:hypothetical protein
MEIILQESSSQMEIALGLSDVLIKKNKNELGRWSPATPIIIKW